MKISYSWLKEFIQTDLTPEIISKYLINLGLEVESIKLFKSVKKKLNGVIIGQIINIKQHSKLSNIKILQIKIAEKKNVQILSNNSNLRLFQKVAVATIGSKIFINESIIKIEKFNIEGENSYGILCSEFELGIGYNYSEIKIFNNFVPIGMTLNKYLNLEKDFIFEISITPNRSDAMSHFGIARDLYAFLNYKKKNVKFFPPKILSPIIKNKNNSYKIEIENSNLCNRYSGVFLKNIIIDESPFWLKNSLKKIGIESINNIIDIVTYITHSLGQPIQVFDSKKIINNIIKIGKCPKNTKFISSQGEIINLYGEELMIKNENEKPIAIAGILNSKEFEINSKTNSIFLEAAYFNPISIRKTSKIHSIYTDYSFRFERGVDPNLTITAIKLTVDLLQKNLKTNLIASFIDEYPNFIKNKKIVLRYDKIDKILGYKIHHNEIKKIINLLDINILSEFNDNLILEVKPYRYDVTREIDVIEEILRIYGYNSIPVPEKIQFSNNNIYLKNEFKFETKLANTLVYNGFYECINNSLVPLNQLNNNEIKLLNPLSKDLAIMRSNLINSLLKNIILNIYQKKYLIKLFEFGKIYKNIDNNYFEKNKLSLVFYDHSINRNNIEYNNQSNFFNLKGIVEQLLNRIGIKNHIEILFSDNIYSQGVKFLKNKLSILKLGVLNKELYNKKIKNKIFAADIDIDILKKIIIKNHKVKELPKFPFSKRDLNLIIDNNITYYQIKNIAFNTEKQLLKKIKLISVYEGPKIPIGKKSYTISFYIQKDIGTLTDEEINSCIKKIFNKINKETKASLMTIN